MRRRAAAVVTWILLMAGLCGAPSGLAAAAPAKEAPASVPRWSVTEIPLAAVGSYPEPHAQVDVTAVFRGPGGIEKSVRGFWKGGKSFALRFTPTVAGPWSYSTRSADAGLDGKTGSFTCTAPVPGSHGFLRRDPAHPYHFVWDDGTRHFSFGQTYYDLLCHKPDEWKPCIDGTLSRGMNKIRFYAPVWDDVSRKKRVGKGRIDLETHSNLDAVLAYMNGKGMVASLIMFDVAGTQEEDERFARYLIARYAAYPNVIWDVINEWNYVGKPREYWNVLGRIVRAEDPWIAEGLALRPLSIHQQTRINFQFFDQPWPVHAIIQYGVRNSDRDTEDEWKNQGKTRYVHGDEWGNAGIVFNLGHNMPVVNDEFGYAGEYKDDSAGGIPLSRTKHRNIIWGIYTAGGYGSAGDKYGYPKRRPYLNAHWQDPAEYGDIQRLVEFFTTKGIEYWKMSSQNALVASGKRVYVLAEPGRQYVVYAAVGGTFSINVVPGTYSARWFNSRTGEESVLPEVTGGGAVSFTAPAGEDTVLYLQGHGPLPPR